jgi:hypothetical protein
VNTSQSPLGYGLVWLLMWVGVPPTIIVVLAMLYGVFALFLPIVGSYYYGKMRRLQREQALRRLVLESDTGSDTQLRAMAAMLDSRFEDVGFHLRYAEMLFARGDYRRAAVEARLLLVQDPYHFNGNLLLANAYYVLGSYAKCLAVCKDYLAVVQYCFEFGELKQRCEARLNPS